MTLTPTNYGTSFFKYNDLGNTSAVLECRVCVPSAKYSLGRECRINLALVTLAYLHDSRILEHWNHLLIRKGRRRSITDNSNILDVLGNFFNGPIFKQLSFRFRFLIPFPSSSVLTRGQRILKKSPYKTFTAILRDISWFFKLFVSNDFVLKAVANH